MNVEDASEWEKFVDLGGRSAQRLGLGRSVGQIYAALYLSPDPLGLEDLMRQLHISKGNASMGVRQLAAWGAVERIWVPGDRRDYYRANADFSRVVRHLLSVVIKPRLESAGNQLRTIQHGLEARPKKGEDARAEFARQRIAKLQRVQKKLQQALPWFEKLL